MIRRREFISLLGGAAAAWPLAAQAQQAERVRRIGVLMSFGADDLEGRTRLTAFLEALQQFGWTDGRTVRIDIRWGGPNADDIRKLAAELVKLAPDVILTSSSVVTFSNAAGDPYHSDCVHDCYRPGWRWLCRQSGTAGRQCHRLYHLRIFNERRSGWSCSRRSPPSLTRVMVLRDPAVASGPGQFAAIQAVAPSLGVELRPVDTRDAGGIERAIAASRKVQIAA